MRRERPGLITFVKQRVPLFAAVVAAIGLGAAGCSFEPGASGTGGSSSCPPDAVSDDGSQICRDGSWVKADATGGFDGDTSGRDSGLPPDATPGDAVGDGALDGGDTDCALETWYRDDDGDGFGTGTDTKMACDQPDGYVSESGDCDDSDDAAHPNASEDCDERDNNCDGTTDEGCGCTYDPTESDNTDTDGSHMSGVCANQTPTSGGSCSEPDDFESRTDAESNCDSKDNDCDGNFDEGCACTYDPNETDNVDTDGSHDDGVCTTSTRDDSGTCQLPSGFFESMTNTESRCQGKDNDCDGITDEGCTCNYKGIFEGVCTNQTIDSSGNCTEPSTFESMTDAEAHCSGKDNDCDSFTDEGCSCIYDPNEPSNADTDGSHDHGVCPGQTRDASGVCQTPGDFETRTPTESSCDSTDNDCDGITDEGCSCTYDPTETNNTDTDGSHANGVCPGQSLQQSDGTCSEPAEFEAKMPGETKCDNLDNDCDGNTDENITRSCYTGKSGTSGTGICTSGTKTCSGGSFGSCQNETIQKSDPVTSEVDCTNSKDDDCDGSTDDCFFRETISASAEIRVEDLAVDSSTGDIYVVGTQGDFSGTTTDAIVAKYDKNGTQQWIDRLSANDIAGRGIAIDPANSQLYIAGKTDAALLGLTLIGGTDGFIAKYSFSGTRQDTTMVGTGSDDIVEDISFDPVDGRVVIGGGTRGNFKGGNSGRLDAFVAEYGTTLLNQQWANQFGGNASDIVEALDVDESNGHVYVGGDTLGEVHSGATHQGSGDIYVARFDSGGNRQWITQSGSSNDDDVRGVSVADGSAVYVVGETEGDLKTISHSGDDDAYVLKWNKSDSMDWIESVSTGSHDDYDAVRYDPDSGDVFAVGSTAGTPDSVSLAGRYDVMVASYTSGGSRNWIELRGTAEGDDGRAVGSSANSSLLAIGGFWNRSSGTADGFLSRIQ